MEHCPNCKNVNVVKEKGVSTDYKWCRNCGWTSDGRETPRIAGR